jgi:serine protease Do
MQASGISGGSVKGGIRRLINTVVDVVEADKNQSDEYKEGRERESSNGAGFIIDENGYIVTNWHVINSMNKIKVIIWDGGEYTARVAGKDERSDIALLKIDADKKLPFVQFADYDKVEVGDPVIAVGNPFGFGKTVTSGVVSYKGRDLSERIAELGAGGDLVYYLQTDAAINYGNSGGPLFSYNAEVVGMITVFFSDGIHNTGINFAIPSNTLKKVVKELRDHGKMQRSWLGIHVSSLGKRAARILLGMGKKYGCVITKVEKNSPAAVAGLQIGDILIAINDEAISEDMNSEFVLNGLPIGKVVPIQVVRHGSEMKLSVMVGTRSDEKPSCEGDETAEKIKIPCEKISGIDIGVTDLNQELRRSFDIREEINGVMISQVGNIGESDLSVGNVILTVNQTNVSNIAELKAELQKLSENPDVRRDKELAVYVFDPQIRKFDYVAVNFDPKAFESALADSGQSVGKKHSKTKTVNIMDELKDKFKVNWRL